jgi:hypothetical protein
MDRQRGQARRHGGARAHAHADVQICAHACAHMSAAASNYNAKCAHERTLRTSGRRKLESVQASGGEQREHVRMRECRRDGAHAHVCVQMRADNNRTNTSGNASTTTWVLEPQSQQHGTGHPPRGCACPLTRR